MGTPFRCFRSVSTSRGDAEWAFAGRLAIVGVTARHPEPLLAMPHSSLRFSICQWNGGTTRPMAKWPAAPFGKPLFGRRCNSLNQSYRNLRLLWFGKQVVFEQSAHFA